MTKLDKIKYVQTCISTSWSCPEDVFSQRKNIIIETDKAFFEIVTFGSNAVIRADKEIFNWCVESFSDIPVIDIMDGENLYSIEKKMREYGRKLGGEHIRYLHLNPDAIVQRPCGFTFELYEKDRLPELYLDNRFDSALNYEYKGEVLAIVARKDKDIAAVVAVDDYHHGLWQIGIDTVVDYRGQGLAAYLVKEIAMESKKRNQVPFYTTWSPNIASTRTAISAGFSPIWMEYFAENI